MKTKPILLAAALVFPLAGCAPDTKSGRGFHMLSGNAQRGEAAFVALECHGCHTVDGVTLPSLGDKRRMAVRLGGEVGRLRTYGELVTAIIHPSRDVTREFPEDAAVPGQASPMRDLTADMTVAQLIDIVTFLEPRYRLSAPQYAGMSP